MTSVDLIDFVYMVVIAIVTVFFIFQMLMASKFLAPRNPNSTKSAAYECGNVSLGDPWVRFHVGYYVFALLFLAFDIEIIFLFPWAVVFKGAGFVALVELAIFVGILVFALFYAWKKGVLRWI